MNKVEDLEKRIIRLETEVNQLKKEVSLKTKDPSIIECRYCKGNGRKVKLDIAFGMVIGEAVLDEPCPICGGKGRVDF